MKAKKSIRPLKGMKAMKAMKAMKRDRAERRRDGSSSDSSDSSLSSDSDSSSLSSRSRSRSPPRDGKPKPRYHNGRPQFDEQTRAQQLGQNVKRPAVQEVTPTMRTLHAPRPKVVLKPRDEKRVASIALNKEITDRNATYKSILNLFDRRGAEFDGVNLSTAVHRLGSRFARSRNIRTDGTVRQLIDRATQLIGEGHATYGARETANTRLPKRQQTRTSRPSRLRASASRSNRRRRVSAEPRQTTVAGAPAAAAASSRSRSRTTGS